MTTLQCRFIYMRIPITVNLLDQYTLTRLSGGGAPFRTASRRAIHLAHTARRFKCTLVYHRFFPLRAYWSIDLLWSGYPPSLFPVLQNIVILFHKQTQIFLAFSLEFSRVILGPQNNFQNKIPFRVEEILIGQNIFQYLFSMFPAFSIDEPDIKDHS